MSIEELRRIIIDDLEALYFVGGYGGSIITRDEVESASDKKLIEIAALLGYKVNIVDNPEETFQK